MKTLLFISVMFLLLSLMAFRGLWEIDREGVAVRIAFLLAILSGLIFVAAGMVWVIMQINS